MKILLAAVLAAFAASPAAQHDHKMAPPSKTEGAAAQTHTAVGVVKSVDAAKGTVTIAHEPVESLRWPRMTMAFKPQDKKQLEQLKPGQKVEFQFVQRGKDYVITKADLR